MGIRRIVTAALVALLLAAPGTAALACGGAVSGDGSAELQGMSALLSFDGRREDLAVAVSYAAPTGRFAWLMPLPATPEIAQTSTEGLIDGFRITTPPLESAYVTSFHGMGSAAPSGGVAELGRTTIGSLEFVTLGASDAGEVVAWMGANGFAFHDTQWETVQAYLARHWVLVAARSNALSRTRSGTVAVRFTFPTPDPVYPLAIAGASHEGQLPMHLLVATPYRPASATYSQTTVWPAADGSEPDPLSRLELRYSSTLSEAERIQVGQSVAVPPGYWLTRYEAQWQLADLTQDLVLKPADDHAKVNFDALYRRFQAERAQSDFGWWLAGTIINTVVGSWLGSALALLVAGALTLLLLGALRLSGRGSS
jgi:hypothetical protein